MLRHRRRRPEARHHDVARADLRAAENLRFIRETMEHSVRFTDVPGVGMVLMGLTAFGAAALAAGRSETAWLTIWGLEAALAMSIGLVLAFRKVKANDSHLLAGPAKKFFLGLTPALVAGLLLTIFLQREGMGTALPGAWLLLYGTAVIAAGTFSIPVIPVGGLCFMVLGAIALFAPAGAGDWLLALGFGGLNVAFGLVIARRYGG